MNKKELRRKMLKRREDLSLTEMQKKSQQINQQILALPPFSAAKTILTYLPIKKEPNTLPLLTIAWQQKKQVLIPVMQAQNKSLILSQLKNLNEVTPKRHDLLEPEPEFLRPTAPHSVDLCLLPGLAFDYSGNRLGYGEGYFDRFLPNLRPTCLKIALAYDFQIFDSIPKAKHDIPIDIIITESTTYICPK